jgi:hypothetical protein
MSADLSVLFMHLSTCHFGALEHSKHFLTAHKSTCVEGCALFFYLSGVWLHVVLRTETIKVFTSDWTTCSKFVKFVNHPRVNSQHNCRDLCDPMAHSQWILMIQSNSR